MTPMMDTIKISSCMAPNMDFVCRELANYLSMRLSIPVEARLDIPWPERERLLDEGQIDLCWICGLPYVRKADQVPSPPRVELVAAPVMQGPRYQDRPIYFSDVVVRSDSPFQTLDDLRGATWAYNEPNSHSGYNVVRYALATRGETAGYFGRVVETGAHQVSLQMILRRQVDGSAIDSTVLEQELQENPGLSSQIRIIDSFGPSPIPPWVASRHTSMERRQALREALLEMDRAPAGQALLNRARLARFTAVTDRDYDPIREMARLAEGVELGNH